MSSAQASGDHANSVARSVDDASVEDVQARLVDAARGYATSTPLTSFGDLIRARNTAVDLVDRTNRPGQEAELYLLLSQTSALLACATLDLGYVAAAKQNARAAYTYARVVSHPTAQAFARAIQATIELWEPNPRRGVDYATQGLSICPGGTVAVRLHAVAARCVAAAGGDGATVEHHLTAAADARNESDDEMCDRTGGEFGFSLARTSFSAGAAYLAMGDGTRAAHAAEAALSLYESEPAADRWYGGEYGARADLVAALVMAGDLEAAESRFEHLIGLPVPQRSERIVRRVNRLVRTLDKRSYAESPSARRMVGMLRAFAADNAQALVPASSH
ncbi:hypothetical protein ACIOBK_33805 [Micromonospora chokoriensis]